MKQRLLWIDFLRGLAVLGMIETHSVNSFLAPVYRTGGWFTFLSYLNGIVAPTFLFIAGFLQGASIRKNWDAPTSFARRFRSIGVLLLLAYALQFPWNSPFDGDKVWIALGRIDVLHCIAISLASLLVLAKLCKRLITFDAMVGLLTIGLILAAPFVWNSTENFPAPIAGYLTAHRGALFPLFPWSAFLLAGALASRLPRMFAVGFLLTTALGWMLKFTMAAWFESQTYATRYDAFLFRLSVVLLGCALCSWLLTTDRLLTRAIQWCGARSLPLYVFHLILLHSGLGILLPPLRDLYPKTQTPTTVFWLFLLTLSATLALTWLWQWVLTHTIRLTRKGWPMDYRTGE
ncbi:MAG: acyltransferase family protein [Chthoniobacterales bacterium]